MRRRPDLTWIRDAVLLWSIAAALAGAAACTPDTDLTDERTRGAGDPGDVSAAGAGLVDPPPGAADVPPNIVSLVLRFAAPVALPEGALDVCAGDVGSRGDAQLVPCQGDGACYRVGIAGALPPGATCRVAIRAPLARDDGTTVAAGSIGQFATAAAPDQTPPVLANVQATLGGGCLDATLSVDEPATIEALVRVGTETTTILLGTGAGPLDLAVPARALAPDGDGDVTLRVTDRAGNVAMSAPIAIHTPPVAPPLAITEVLANPLGAEPDQEFVELRNLGDAPVSLEGLRIEDSRGGDTLPAVDVGAGAYALVVGPGFDALSVIDVPPRPGTTLVRLQSRIGSDGLSNTGEVVRLRAAGAPDAAVISSYGGWVDVSAKAWAGHSVRRAPEDACDRPESWNRTPLAATPGW